MLVSSGEEVGWLSNGFSGSPLPTDVSVLLGSSIMEITAASGTCDTGAGSSSDICDYVATSPSPATTIGPLGYSIIRFRFADSRSLVRRRFRLNCYLEKVKRNQNLK